MAAYRAIYRDIQSKITCFFTEPSVSAAQWRTQEFCSWGRGGSTNSVEDRGQNGDVVGGSPLVRGSGDSCNLVKEIQFRIVKFS